MDFNKKIEISEKEQKVSRWWNRNRHKIFRIVLFPLYFVYLGIEWVKKKGKGKQKEDIFSKDRAKKILDKWLPAEFAFKLRHTKTKEGEKENILITDGSDFGDIQIRASGVRWIKSKKDMAYCFAHWGQFKKYVIEEYEIEGWEARRIKGWTEWDEACEEFGWRQIYGSEKDNMAGVVFYRGK